MKFYKGRRVEGHWVFGMMIEDGNEDVRIFVCPNNRRRAEDLIPMIESWVEKGTIIRSDCWKAYGSLESRGYEHQTVNHSSTFVTETGVHANRIEATWRPLKDHFRKIEIRSVCQTCQAKFNDAKVEGKDDNAKLQELYKKIREERGECKGCKKHESSRVLRCSRRSFTTTANAATNVID